MTRSKECIEIWFSDEKRVIGIKRCLQSITDEGVVGQQSFECWVVLSWSQHRLESSSEMVFFLHQLSQDNFPLHLMSNMRESDHRFLDRRYWCLSLPSLLASSKFPLLLLFSMHIHYWTSVVMSSHLLTFVYFHCPTKQRVIHDSKGYSNTG